MMQSMKGATQLLGSMNRQMNLPALQRIAMEFEKENDIMDQRQEMMDDAIDDVTGLEDEEESEEVVTQVLDEIGVDLGQSVRLHVLTFSHNLLTCRSLERLHKVFRRTRLRTARLHKPSEAILVTMICKHGWTAYEDDDYELLLLEQWIQLVSCYTPSNSAREAFQSSVISGQNAVDSREEVKRSLQKPSRIPTRFDDIVNM